MVCDSYSFYSDEWNRVQKLLYLSEEWYSVQQVLYLQ